MTERDDAGAAPSGFTDEEETNDFLKAVRPYWPGARVVNQTVH
jgi:hypothetical protein